MNIPAIYINGEPSFYYWSKKAGLMPEVEYALALGGATYVRRCPSLSFGCERCVRSDGAYIGCPACGVYADNAEVTVCECGTISYRCSTLRDDGKMAVTRFIIPSFLDREIQEHEDLI